MRDTRSVGSCRTAATWYSAESLLRWLVVNWDHRVGPPSDQILWILHDLADVLFAQGRVDEARLVFMEAIDRFSQAFGFCHFKTAGTIGRLQETLRETRDFTALRDLNEGWIEQILAMPPDSDPGLRHRRAVRLAAEAAELATLPPAVTFNSELTLRAVEEATVLSPGWSGAWSFLGVVHYRLGQPHRAEEAIGAALRRNPDPQEHPFNDLVLALVHARRGERDQACWPLSSVTKRSPRR